MENNLPFISIIIPCRNEKKYIEKCLDSVINQNYPKDKLEVLIVDGISDDGSREILSEYAQKYFFIKLLDNPKIITSCALNIGIKNAHGSFIIWMSAHNFYEKDYILKCIENIKKFNVDNVGGIIIPTTDKNSLVAKSIVKVLSHPFGVGNSYFRISSKLPKYVDTVFGGCYKKEIFEKVGLFNERLIRGQDMEFNLRLKNRGGKILLIPEIKSYYYCRSDIKSFCKHNFINGIWAILPFKFSRDMPVAIRHLVPLFFVLTIIILSFLTAFLPKLIYYLISIISFYLLVNLYFSLKIAIREKNLRLFLLLPIVFICLHISYGLGSIYGLLKIFIPADNRYMLHILRKIIREIAKEWRHRNWWQFRLPSLFARFTFHYIIKEKNDGVYVMEEDWDNLIILDACRYDIFAETNWINGILEKINSRGSHTWMFLKENFLNRYFFDTVYVSSNPFIWEVKDSFYRIVYVAPKNELETYGTVLPETVAESALNVNKSYPDKRLIIHFLQPHYPFIGETKIEKNEINPFYLFARGKIEKDLLMQAYKDNLKRVLLVVERLIKELLGKTVITSDHGEAFGEKIKFFPIKIYGHSGPRIKGLIEVPWLVIDKFPRKQVKEALKKDTAIPGDYQKIKKHLQVLGYI